MRLLKRLVGGQFGDCCRRRTLRRRRVKTQFSKDTRIFHTLAFTLRAYQCTLGMWKIIGRADLILIDEQYKIRPGGLQRSIHIALQLLFYYLSYQVFVIN
ncbi:hypothetical protein CEXT_687661 [Caerostris extrusa]|uniref:Uncharacterized protein n=1 Tax=Caerostris extrusa TaxID=172846 RepID=A0AAV4TZM5_CAEEX|nr:hypothetical protein CEXT_687661 [Caerostris extrusa]